ncbi:MAG: phage minor capsid protein, partial [Clostridia bacterium]|nr:phage minor capsid protein [Clostridia bacterium]
YQSLVEATDYGDVTGLCGANCRHSFFPYVEGVSEQLPEEKYDETTYKNEQIQRYNERQIRSWKKRSETLKAGGVDDSAATSKVTEWQKKQRDFLKGTGLTRQYQRERIAKK